MVLCVFYLMFYGSIYAEIKSDSYWFINVIDKLCMLL